MRSACSCNTSSVSVPLKIFRYNFQLFNWPIAPMKSDPRKLPDIENNGWLSFEWSILKKVREKWGKSPNSTILRIGKSFKLLEPALGFEPRTYWLRISCSTAELRRPNGDHKEECRMVLFLACFDVVVNPRNPPVKNILDRNRRPC